MLRVVAAVVAVAAAPVAEAAGREPICADVAVAAGALWKNWREMPAWSGKTSANGFILRIYASADGATWTALFIEPTGRACVLDRGTNWIGELPVSALVAPRPAPAPEPRPTPKPARVPPGKRRPA
jgi:hypothetical protein